MARWHTPLRAANLGAALLALVVLGIGTGARGAETPKLLPPSGGKLSAFGNLILFSADGPAALQRARAALRRAGIPQYPNDIQQPAIPPARNAAGVYRRLQALLKEKPLDENAWKIGAALSTRRTFTGAEIDSVRQLLADREDVLALVHRAAAMPKCNFERDWSQSPWLTFPEYAVLRNSARLLRAESYLLAREGRFNEAIRHLEEGFRIEEHANTDPWLLGFLTGSACRSLLLAGFVDVLTLAGPNANVASKVQESLRAHPLRADVRRALGGEVAMSGPYFDLVRRGGYKSLAEVTQTGDSEPDPHAQTLAHMSPGEQAIWPKFIDACEADYLRRMQQRIAIVNLPYARREILAARQEKDLEQNHGNLTVILSAVMLPSLGVQGEGGEAQQVALEAGAAVLQYRAKNGRWPSRLSQAIHRVPLDPFNGKPLGYREEPNGFVVFSVGRTGAFDGGRPGGGTNERGVFRYPADLLPRSEP